MGDAIWSELFRYGQWANGRILAACSDLADEQLDQPKELGLGSLRNTLFHVMVVEEIWLERWLQKPWRSFQVEAKGTSLQEIEERLREVANQRDTFLQQVGKDVGGQVCHYRDARGNPQSNRLDELLMHVANHGIHHRAQALHFLKSFGKTFPGGLDFLFYRFAHPVVRQSEETVQAMRHYGMQVDLSPGHAFDYDAATVRSYFAYGDWANQILMQVSSTLDSECLDRSFGLGMDTIRKTMLHIQDGERWWLNNWLIGPTPFDQASESTSLESIQQTWTEVIDTRSRFLQTLDPASAKRIVTAQVGLMTIQVELLESLIQLGGHGTHHRAQWVNMLRKCGKNPPPVDYIVWVREQNKNL